MRRMSPYFFARKLRIFPGLPLGKRLDYDAAALFRPSPWTPFRGTKGMVLEGGFRGIRPRPAGVAQ